MTETASAIASVAAAPRALGGAQLVTRDTNLRIDSFNGAAGVTLTIVARLIGFDGEPVTNIFTHTPLTTRLIKTETFPLGEGWLLSAQVYASVGTPKRAQCFVRLSLVQGFTGATLSEATLLQNYVSDTNAIAWPGSPIIASTEGPGFVRGIVGANPAAGVEIAETVPANTRWLLKAFRFQLQASAAAANRRPTLIIDDAVNELWRVNSNVNQVATELSVYQAGAGAPFATLDTRIYALPLPFGLLLSEGYRVRTSTAAIDAGDDYAAPIYTVEEWIED